MKKYEELKEYINKEYLSSRNEYQMKLPSVRELTQIGNCSKNSVLRAYEELEREHKIFSIPKSGYYTIGTRNKKEEKEVQIDFVTSNPDSRVLPYREFTHCLNRAVDLYGESLFLYPEAMGLSSFRKALAKTLADRNVYVNKEQICITNGVQQAIALLFSTKTDQRGNKDTILYEIPGYPMAVALAKREHWNIEYIERTEDGIVIEKLEAIFRQGNIRYFYLMPRFHNPTGSCLSEYQKLQITALAKKYDVYLIEDDYLGELDADVKRLPLYYYDQAEHVIYIAGFSKSFMPGLRLGAVCLPKQLVKVFCMNKYEQDLGSSVYLQGAMELFFTNGFYQRHRKKVMAVYAEKMKLCRSVYENYQRLSVKDGIRCCIPESGYYLWLWLPQRYAGHGEALYVNYLKEKGILVSEGSRFYPKEQTQTNCGAIRICISNCTIEQLREGLNVIFYGVVS